MQNMFYVAMYLLQFYGEAYTKLRVFNMKLLFNKTNLLHTSGLYVDNKQLKPSLLLLNKIKILF